MNVVPVKTPLIAKRLFSNYVWDIDTINKELYLTFDDGPTPEITKWTLDILRQYNAKATFFCIGSNIEKYPDIFEHIIRDGHTIGNHTQHHVKGWKSTTNDYLIEVEKAQLVINNCLSAFQASFSEEKKVDTPKINGDVNFFRPPYGQIRPDQGKKLMALGYNIIMWDVLSFDWQQDISQEDCLKNVISKSKSGSIIVFHDSLKASKNMMYALPEVLEIFSKKGFVFKALNV